MQDEQLEIAIDDHVRTYTRAGGTQIKDFNDERVAIEFPNSVLAVSIQPNYYTGVPEVIRDSPLLSLLSSTLEVSR